jgi:hypothetical protein
MGGFVTLDTGLTHLDTFGELYGFSSGSWQDQLPAFQENIKSLLGNPNINDKFRMPIYFAAGGRTSSGSTARKRSRCSTITASAVSGN